MEEREGNKVNAPRVILAFIIAAAVLGFAFMQGYMVSYLSLQRASNIQNDLKIDLLDSQLSGALLQECNEEALAVFSSKLDHSGVLISLLEDKFGKDDKIVLDQKKQYALLEIQHFLTIKDYSERCNKKIDLLLFFYSNSKEYGEEAKNIGKILDKVKSERDRKVMVYSFDYDLDMDIVKFMKILYNVTSPDTIVVNEKLNLEHVENIDEILNNLNSA